MFDNYSYIDGEILLWKTFHMSWPEMGPMQAGHIVVLTKELLRPFLWLLIDLINMCQFKAFTVSMEKHVTCACLKNKGKKSTDNATFCIGSLFNGLFSQLFA